MQTESRTPHLVTGKIDTERRTSHLVMGETDTETERRTSHLVQGKEKWIEVVGAGLQKAVHGVEGVAGERGRHLPGVVGLVQVLVHQAVVQEAVNPVVAGVGESDEGEAAQHNAAPTCQSQTL